MMSLKGSPNKGEGGYIAPTGPKHLGNILSDS